MSYHVITLAVSLYSYDPIGQGYIYTYAHCIIFLQHMSVSLAVLSTHVTKCVLSDNSTLLSTSLLPAASPFSALQFLKTYQEEFVEVVNAKQSLLKLKREGVISPDVKRSIEDANDEDAKYLLLEHLEKNTTVDTLREYCKVAIAADGLPRMQELGRKMLNALPPEKG